MSSNKNIADTILAQLGGGRFAAMTGSKNFQTVERGLTFKIGRNDSKITHCTITLRGDDTYDVRFQRVYGMKITERGLTEGAYADMLRPLFETATGMYTSL